ncbi:uncharacterized protein LOC122627014 isoform X1 [Vespula pensylvanica]|uniref:uncharacterized protein LOC122627014 isoform X1 n=1 Tax=Vespula pensylvanica TaxID=30213 RepID=UPI001CBA24F0|nr:uncharacterized protein LOC122627014 isoform X1 [Vespula pensylvanica]XP_043663668.1 uncharacterized protein LOC122627014 isoform X1 [Vespula pensylvanica]
MAGEYFETTYVPEIKDAESKERERQLVQEGTAMWKHRKEEFLRQKHREQRELREILENYSPWGKPGGGAPCPATLRKKNVLLEPLEPVKSHMAGQSVQSWPWGRPGPGGLPWRDPKLLGVHFLESMGWTSDSTIRKLSRKRDIDPLTVPDMNKFFDANVESDIASNLQSSRDTRSLYNEEVQVYKLTGGVELVPLLTSRRYHSQPQSIRYHVTDITRPGYTIESLRSLEISNRKYIAELAEQIRWKQDRACEERRAEQESCRRHFDTWRKLWGRPGHGAPIDHVHRNNLYNILYRPVIY